jgi:long-subunit fatty acid transport protein
MALSGSGWARSALLTVLIAAPAHAGGFGIPEIGLRETAMGAVLGRPDDGSAIVHDPAGLVLAPGWRVTLAAGLALPRTTLQLAPWDGGRSSAYLGVSPGADGYYAPVRPSVAFAVVPMLSASAEVLPGRLWLGLATFVGNATGAAFHDGAVTRYHLLSGYIVAPQLMAAAAYQLRPDLAIGASLGAVYMTVHGEREVYPFIMGYDVSSIIGTHAHLVLDGSAWAPAWSVGAFGRPHPRVTWGATVTGRVDATLEGPVLVTYSSDARVPGDTAAGIQHTSMLLPWTFAGGANVDVTPHVEVGAEARYWLYHQYTRQHSDISGIFFVRAIDVPKNYRDSGELSGGVRVHDLAALPALDLMAGLNFDESSAPANTITLDEPVFTHYGIHTGARYTVGRYRLGASYTHYWYEVPTITDSITIPPTNLKGYGDLHMVTVSVEAAL